MFDECVLGVRANVFTTNVRAVVNVHVVNSERWLHLWFLMLQASVCDEQIMSIGGEIALSRNKKNSKKTQKKLEKKNSKTNSKKKLEKKTQNKNLKKTQTTTQKKLRKKLKKKKKCTVCACYWRSLGSYTT